VDRLVSRAGLDGLADRSHRPRAHPAQTSPEVEAAICELRRTHSRWGQRRIEFDLGRTGCPGPIPSVSTIYRVLGRHGLVQAIPRLDFWHTVLFAGRSGSSARGSNI
jgi:hypothetical protein